MITGLDPNKIYCAHSPIPVGCTMPNYDEVAYMNINIGGVGMLTNPPKLYKSLDDDFKIDISPWVRQFMPDFKDMMTYTSSPAILPNPQMQVMDIVIYNDIDSYNVETTFSNCATCGWTLDEDGFVDTRVWECYPFSYPTADFEDIVYHIVTDPIIVLNKNFEYIPDCCSGTYIKWLNRYGYYSYWLFPRTSSKEASGEEYFRVTQNIFDPNRDGSHKTAGFESERILTVRDMVPRKYWGMFEDLVTSPEVTMLRRDYVLGDDVAPSDWIRLIQDSPTFETDNSMNSAEFEMGFVLPKKYVQTRL